MNKWPSYSQIFLNTSGITKFEKVLNLGKIYLIHPRDHIKVNESYYKQCGVTPHFSTGQNILSKDKYWQKLLKKISREGKYLQNQLRSADPK